MIKNNLEGRYCYLKIAEVSDSEFILSLRQDEKKSRYLSPTDVSVAQQIEWMKCYKERENSGVEYYFIITDKELKPVGTYRLYGIGEEFATPGSWIIKDNTDYNITFESVLLMYEFVFEKLNKSVIKFDVRKGNKKVQRFHESYGSKIVSETEEDIFYEFERSNFDKMKYQFTKYIG